MMTTIGSAILPKAQLMLSSELDVPVNWMDDPHTQASSF